MNNYIKIISVRQHGKGSVKIVRFCNGVRKVRKYKNVSGNSYFQLILIETLATSKLSEKVKYNRRKNYLYSQTKIYT